MPELCFEVGLLCLRHSAPLPRAGGARRGGWRAVGHCAVLSGPFAEYTRRGLVRVASGKKQPRVTFMWPLCGLYVACMWPLY